MTANVTRCADGEKRSVTIKLNGQRFPIRTDDDEAYLEDLAEFINRKLDEVRRATGRVETGQIALLALLNIADDLFRQRRENQRLKDDIGGRAEALLCTIDEMASALELKEAVAGARSTGSGRAP